MAFADKKRFFSASLVFLNLLGFSLSGSGVMGCSSSGDGTTGTEEVTAEEQQALTSYFLGANALNDGLTSANGESALVLKAQDVDIGSFLCHSGGSASSTRDTSSGDITVTFDGCQTDVLAAVPEFNVPEMIIIFTGQIVIGTSSIRYNNLNMIVQSGSGATVHTVDCTADGTITTTLAVATSGFDFAADSTYDITSTCVDAGTTVIRNTGSLQSQFRSSDGSIFMTGSAQFAFSGGRVITCTYDNFNVGTATCATMAEACGLSPATACRTTGS